LQTSAAPSPATITTHSSQTLNIPTPPATSRQLLALRATGSLNPLFLIHPVGGRTNNYDALACHLNANLPVYALQSRVFAGADDEWRSLDEMARSYADLIAERQPEGSIRIAGFSAGGIFALATASQLERRGRTVAHLLMIESPVTILDPDVPRVAIMENLIHEMYDYVSASLVPFGNRRNGHPSPSPLQIAHRILRATTEDARLLLVMEWLGKQGLSVPDNEDTETRRFFRAFIRHSQFIESARIEPILAPVHSWRANDSWLTSSPTSAALRSRITKGAFTQSTVEGRHFEVMDEPGVRALAKQVDKLLQPPPTREPAPHSAHPPRLVAEKSIKPQIAAMRRP
jgi:thioesterase domain-containing protein